MYPAQFRIPRALARCIDPAAIPALLASCCDRPAAARAPTRHSAQPGRAPPLPSKVIKRSISWAARQEVAAPPDRRSCWLRRSPRAPRRPAPTPASGAAQHAAAAARWRRHWPAGSVGRRRHQPPTFDRGLHLSICRRSRHSHGTHSVGGQGRG